MDKKALYERFEFRNIEQGEAEQAAEIERICFPPNEACSEKNMCDRVRDISELFLVAVDKGNGKIAGFLNGLATDEPKLRDEFFTDAGLHNPTGKILCCWDWMFCRNTVDKDLQENWLPCICRENRRKGAARLFLPAWMRK